MNNLRSPNMQSIGKRSNITLGTALSTDPAIGHEKRPPLPDANDDPTVVGNMQSPRESARPWTPCLSPALAFHSPPFGGRGWGWVSNAKRVPTAHGHGNPRLLKGGGYLLSRIALQYHRRRRA